MRSIRFLAVATGALVLGSACGGGGGVDPNTPVANFTVGTCTTGAPCQFTNTSTPAGLTYLWTFGDANAPVAEQTSVLKDPTHTFSVAGDYTVSLKVTDASAATNTKTTTVTVTAGANLPPTASFDAPLCSAGACAFHSTSTDVDGTIAPASTVWDFGDPTSPSNTASGVDATHSYNVTAVKDFTVTLTVTDDKGATASATQVITISPAASCQNASGQNVACTLNIAQKATVTITLADRSCELQGNQFYIVAPIAQTIFLNGCSVLIGTVYQADGPNADNSFSAATGLQVKFTQGAGKAGDPPKGPPAVRLTGAFPDWTIAIDDGGNVAEPADFNDLILTVHATQVP